MIASASTLALTVLLGLLVVDILWVIVGFVRGGRRHPDDVDDAASRRRLLDELGRQP